MEVPITVPVQQLCQYFLEVTKAEKSTPSLFKKHPKNQSMLLVFVSIIEQNLSHESKAAKRIFVNVLISNCRVIQEALTFRFTPRWIGC